MKKTITVLMPIEVSDSNFCWNYEEDICCPNFDFGTCFCGFHPKLDKNKMNYLKPSECKNLLWQENVK